MVGIIDYGVGNLFSLRSSFAAIGVEAFVSGDAAELAKADRLILPGVGAFGDAAQKLRDSGLDAFVKEQAASGKPLMGISSSRIRVHVSVFVQSAKVRSCANKS